jgi:hypothetical protein
MVGGDAAQIPNDTRQNNMRTINNEDDDMVSTPKQPENHSSCLILVSTPIYREAVELYSKSQE